jgi:hypothetical protein
MNKLAVEKSSKIKTEEVKELPLYYQLLNLPLKLSHMKKKEKEHLFGISRFVFD